MVERVNPPPHIRLGPEIQKNKELTRVFGEIGFNLFQLWKRTGGGEDLISDSSTIIDNIYSRQSFDSTEQNEASVSEYFFERFPLDTEIINASSDFTTTGSQIVICTNSTASTISLNSLPEDGEKVKVKRQNTMITIDGNGNTIDGRATLPINFRYDSPQLVYTLAANEWSIV